MKKKKEIFLRKKVSPLYPDPHLPPITEDFRKTIQWRIFRIIAEFIEGFNFIADIKKAVTVFGSTSIPRNHPYYKEAEKLGKLLVKEGYAVITGGGPGIMEAANKGAFKAGGVSIGMNIELPEGQRMNDYVTKPIGFHYFFVRKVMLSFSSDAYVFFPGGFGTLDEFFEMVTLLQTKKILKPVPIIAVKKDYWESLFDWLEEKVYKQLQAIKREDLQLFQIVDKSEEVIEILRKKGT